MYQPQDLASLSVQQLKAELREVDKSIEMLRKSNEQMREIDPERKDNDFIQAIEENLGVLRRRGVRRRAVVERLAQLEPGGCESADAVRADAGVGDEGLFL